MPPLSKGLAMVTVAAALAGCQFPGFPSPQQTATLPPPTVPKPPPEERGIWIVGSPSMRGAVGTAASRFNSTPDTQPRLVAEGTNNGFRSFCAGVGLEHPDMVVSDRRIGAEEQKRCRAKGITMMEYELGPKQFVYVKDAHMMTIPGVRDFTDSWGVKGKPVRGA
ncbi:phosphate transport system substrate-binding protein [Azospirillum sp. OGB3]|uniref:substrate-binding domain-containing protein n=1 Tax=Azospirillum sp. OGB3 TaxID=2587012 RepID=UPI0017B69EE9|nr:phosphate transport system substrate-binding protein [Azospirillum sp. OGB3]